MARTDAEQIEFMKNEAEQANLRFNQLFNRNIDLQANNDRLRTELDIVKGWIGCFSDEHRKTSNAEWILARTNAALEITP